MESLDIATSVVRELTDDEVRQFHDNGWVFVKGYVRQDIAKKMLEIGKKRMTPAGNFLFEKEKVANVKNWWWEVSNIAREEDLFADIAYSPVMGQNVQRLFRRDDPILYIGDSMMAKAPAGGKNGSAPTSWHQDIPSFPFDRSGTVTCWLGLDHLTPDMGTMHFLEGSHKGELYGRMPASEDPLIILKRNPHLIDEYEEVGSPTFEPGDATFHHCQIVHGAPANKSDRMRWSYTLGYMSADCLYTGANCVYTDDLDLPVEQPISHPNFPQIWPADR